MSATCSTAPRTAAIAGLEPIKSGALAVMLTRLGTSQRSVNPTQLRPVVVRVEALDSGEARGGTELRAELGALHKSANRERELIGVSRSNAEGVDSVREQFGRAAGGADNHCAPTSHRLRDGQAERLGLSRSVKHDIERAVDRDRVGGERDEADAIHESARFRLRSQFGLVNWAAV